MGADADLLCFEMGLLVRLFSDWCFGDVDGFLFLPLSVYSSLHRMVGCSHESRV